MYIFERDTQIVMDDPDNMDNIIHYMRAEFQNLQQNNSDEINSLRGQIKDTQQNQIEIMRCIKNQEQLVS